MTQVSTFSIQKQVQRYRLRVIHFIKHFTKLGKSQEIDILIKNNNKTVHLIFCIIIIYKVFNSR